MSYTREQRAAKAAAQAVAADPAPQAVATIAMVRDPQTNPPPYSADVHPDEVANYRAAGWRPKD